MKKTPQKIYHLEMRMQIWKDTWPGSWARDRRLLFFSYKPFRIVLLRIILGCKEQELYTYTDNNCLTVRKCIPCSGDSLEAEAKFWHGSCIL